MRTVVATLALLTLMALATGHSGSISTATAQEVTVANVAVAPQPGGLTQLISGTTSIQALIDAQTFNVASVWKLDVQTQQWLTFVVGAPVFVNTLVSLETTDIITLKAASTPIAPASSTPTPQVCDPWPSEILAILDVLTVPDDLCLRRFSDPSDRPDWMKNVDLPPTDATPYTGVGAAYSIVERTVLFAFSRNPYTGELGGYAHEICHAHQHRVAIDQNRLLSDWVATPEGADFVQAVGWQLQDGEWALPAGERGFFGQLSPIEDAAEFCSQWYDPSRYWDTQPGSLSSAEPARYQWAQRWLNPLTQAAKCSPWPAELTAMMERLPLPDGLCLRRFAEASEAPSGLQVAGAAYSSLNREVLYLFGAPFSGEIGAIAHELCHASQHVAVLNAGFGDSLAAWYETAEGIDYVDTTLWRLEDGAWIEQPERSNIGYVSPLEASAQACAIWFDPGGHWEPTHLTEFAPLQAEWLQRWRPR